MSVVAVKITKYTSDSIIPQPRLFLLFGCFFITGNLNRGFSEAKFERYKDVCRCLSPVINNNNKTTICKVP